MGIIVNDQLYNILKLLEFLDFTLFFVCWPFFCI